MIFLPIKPAPAGASPAALDKDDLKRQYNPSTGKVSFISTDNGLPLAATKVLGFEPANPALAYVEHFAPEFGLKSPAQDLTMAETSRAEGGRLTVLFQQQYQGVPVMAGELIVSTDGQGNLYSINGEVSSNLSLSTNPEISADDARQTALQSMGKWYKAAPADFTASEPELWIYDPNLMGPGEGPVSLVWRMEVRSNEIANPVNELILVDARRGGIALHFNQIDTAFSKQDPDPSLPATIAIVSGSGQSAVSGEPFGQNFVVKVENQSQQPLSGIEVTFTAPESGASGFFSDAGSASAVAATDNDGLATAPTFTSNDVSGDFIVTATIAGLPDIANFSLTNLAPSVDDVNRPSTVEDTAGIIKTVDGASDVLTYTANHTTSLPGALLCNATDLTCTDGADLDADNAHTYAIGTIQLYYDQYTRMSFDNSGGVVISTVRFSSGYDNAFWNGTQMVYGDAYGFARADDVVAHELTHAVTERESNLFYYYQSGAINESFSDVWGEYYDQTNGLGNDTPSAKWQLGEDITGMGAIRSMSNPPAFLDPDRMTSPYYYTGQSDNGGVHYNSGVNNKAVYLLVDGGSFNGRTITGIGWDKTAAIYYEAATDLLTSGSDYSDLYYALGQACINLTGPALGITPTDCLQVKNATEAVEMNLQPVPNFNPDAPVCSPMQPTNDALFDGLESGTSNWTFNNGAYTRWQRDSSFYGPFAHSGSHSLYADDAPDLVTDATARLASVTVPANAYLHFSHSFDFDQWAGTYYDGGVLEYSTNGGGTWQDATALIDNNGYNGTLTSGYGNPLSGRQAFVGTSHGYISTRLNLSSLAGQTVTFRWRLGLDDSFFAMGWWVDDVRIYTCVAPTFTDVPFDYSVTLGGITYYLHDYIEALYDAGYTAGCLTGPLRYCPDNTMTRAESAVFMLRGEFGSGYSPPPEPWGSFADDWSLGAWAEKWAEGMLDAAMTAGCQASPLKFCPWDLLPREQAAVFGLRMKYGMTHNPPAASGTLFADMTDTGYWGTKWAEQAYLDGLIPACGTSGGKPMFCPNDLFTRAWGSYLIVKAKGMTPTP